MRLGDTAHPSPQLPRSDPSSTCSTLSGHVWTQPSSHTSFNVHMQQKMTLTWLLQAASARETKNPGLISEASQSHNHVPLHLLRLLRVRFEAIPSSWLHDFLAFVFEESRVKPGQILIWSEERQRYEAPTYRHGVV